MCEFYSIYKKDKKWISEPLKRLADYSKIPGVWFVLGKKTNDEDEFICLDVAETSDIQDEIDTDISYSKMDFDELVKKYGNKYPACNIFGEAMFDCNKNYFRKCLWAFTKNNYSVLKFVIINKRIEDTGDRRALERYIAFKFDAIHWRDRKPYIIEGNIERKKQIIDKYCIGFENNNPEYNGLSTAIDNIIR